MTFKLNPYRLADLVIATPNPQEKGQETLLGGSGIVIARNDDGSVKLFLENHGEQEQSYPASCLEFVSHNRSALLEKWEISLAEKKSGKRVLAMPDMLRNFTAILPVTCNAKCNFCPEKEMEHKAKQEEWQDGLIKHIKQHSGIIDHVSISGGEPTLRMKFLFETIDRIQRETPVQNVGLTTNGFFLEKTSSVLGFLDLNTNDELESKLSHLNISMHSFDREVANKIMGVNYTWTLDDLVRFRNRLGKKVSFHINFVINKENYPRIEQEMNLAHQFMVENPWVDVVFRVDYSNEKENNELREYGQNVLKWRDATRGSIKEEKEARKRIQKKPFLVLCFDEVFCDVPTLDKHDMLFTHRREKDFYTDACASCFTHRSPEMHHSYAWLKASAFEPNAVEPEYTEMVYHMDGELYFDWSRNDPVPEPKKVRKPRTVKSQTKMPKVVKSAKPKVTVRKRKKNTDDKRCSFTTVVGSCNFKG